MNELKSMPLKVGVYDSTILTGRCSSKRVAVFDIRGDTLSDENKAHEVDDHWVYDISVGYAHHKGNKSRVDVHVINTGQGVDNLHKRQVHPRQPLHLGTM